MPSEATRFPKIDPEYDVSQRITDHVFTRDGDRYNGTDEQGLCVARPITDVDTQGPRCGRPRSEHAAVEFDDGVSSDPELNAMQLMAEHLEPLEVAQRARVLRYLKDRYGD